MASIIEDLSGANVNLDHANDPPCPNLLLLASPGSNKVKTPGTDAAGWYSLTMPDRAGSGWPGTFPYGPESIYSGDHPGPERSRYWQLSGCNKGL